VDSGNNSLPSVDAKRPTIQPETRFSSTFLRAGTRPEARNPRLLNTAGGFDSHRAHSGTLAAFRGRIVSFPNGNRKRALVGFLSRLRLRRRTRFSSKAGGAAHPGDEGHLSPSPYENLNLQHTQPRFRAAPA
jgi:hypothetical protein